MRFEVLPFHSWYKLRKCQKSEEERGRVELRNWRRKKVWSILEHMNKSFLPCLKFHIKMLATSFLIEPHGSHYKTCQLFYLYLVHTLSWMKSFPFNKTSCKHKWFFTFYAVRWARPERGTWDWGQILRVIVPITKSPMCGSLSSASCLSIWASCFFNLCTYNFKA